MRPVASEEIPVADSRSPAGALVQPEKPTVLVEQMGDDVILRERRGPAVLGFQIGVGGFLLLWWVGWTIGCAFLVGWIVAQPNLETILFAIPFLDAWFFVLLLLCAIYFGRTWVRLGPDGLVDNWTILLFRGRRDVGLDEIKGITEYAKVVDSDSGRTEHGVEIVTLGRSIRFGLGAQPEERQRLIALLERHLRILQDGARAPQGAATADKPRPPSDSEITLQRAGDRLVFVRRYPWRGGAVTGMTFLNLFWNGVVAIFLLQLVKHFLWFLFLFLIPFEVIGAVMLAAWLAALTSPWQRREWAFHPETITARVSVLGLGRTHTFDPLCLDRIELCKGVRRRRWLAPPRLPDEEDDRSFALSFVEGGGGDMFAIDELTEGEARWLESELRAAIKGLFSGRTGASTRAGALWDRWLDGPA